MLNPYFMKNRIHQAFNSLRTSLCLLSLLSMAAIAVAEGSRELNSSTNIYARRVFLSQGIGQTNGTNWYKITSVDSIEARSNFYVYANTGDSISLASSALGIGLGSIELIRPDGTQANLYTTAPLDTGLIRAGAGSRLRELQGPFGLYGGGTGYIPRVFVADQPGIWIVRLLSPLPSSGASNYSPFPPLANADFNQPNNNVLISAFDISIIHNGIIQLGRAYANYMALTGGALSQGSAPKRYANQYFDLFVLTREGYRYDVSFHGLAPYGYFVYTDNVGIQLNDGVTPAYESIKYQPTQPTNRRIFIPDVDPETVYESKHKMFFNSPDITMPATATQNNATVWLYSVLVPSTYNTTVGFFLTGIPNQLAGDFSFDIPNFGVRYKLAIDLNNNQTFGDSSDVNLYGATSAGTNTISWDGLDGFGNAAGYGCFNVRIEFIAGELHIPLADAENFRGGIQIKRLNGNGTLPDYQIHWNDLPLSDNNDDPPGSYLKITPTLGVSSQFDASIDTSVRRWEFRESVPTENYTGNPTHNTVQYGDTRFMDQWAYDTLSSNIFVPLACYYPLAVYLKSFMVKNNHDSPELTWKFSQQPAAGTSFIVQRRSATDFQFATLTSIAVQQGKDQYTYKDLYPEANTYYYRIVMTEDDGKLVYSPVKTITISNKLNTRIFPNPVHDYLQIRAGKEIPVSVKLYDQQGQAVRHLPVNQSLTMLDVKQLSNGIYLVEVLYKNGARQLEKIQINHP